MVIDPSDKLPKVEVPVAVTFLNPVMSLLESTITALLAVIVPAVTPSNCAISVPEISESPTTSVPPDRNNLRQGLAAEPKSKVDPVVGIKSAEILFVSKPPPVNCI